MKQIKTYWGEFQDGSIEDVLPSVLAEAKDLGREEFIYLSWNGVFILIDKKSTFTDCMNQYHKGLREKDVYTDYKCGRLISKEDLGKKIVNLLTKIEGL